VTMDPSMNTHRLRTESVSPVCLEVASKSYKAIGMVLTKYLSNKTWSF